MSLSMYCPIHDVTVPSAGREDFELVCPECEQLWAARGYFYRLAQHDDEQPSPDSE
jgi:Zn-finger nucleic acid-binding protein